MIIFLKLIFLSALISWTVFHLFPPVWSMANNADSLILLDIANDIWSGKSLYGWNFPRVLYIFPDLLIALIVMAPGWYQDATLLTIATINYSLLTLLVHRLLTQLNLDSTPSIPVTAILIAISLAIFAGLFPFSMSNIFWQIFASGAHFLSVMLVVFLFSVISRNRSEPVRASTGIWISLLVFLAALSNTMSALLIGVMMLTRWFCGQVDTLYQKQRIVLVRLFEVWVGLAVVGGVVLGAQIPRQSMANSFFSSSRFQYSIDVFVQWLSTTWIHFVFLAVLLVLTLYWAILSTPLPRTTVFSLPKSIRQWVLVARSPYLFPALAIFVAAPLFYQEITRSLRYYAFPSLLALMVISLGTWFIFQAYVKSKVPQVLVGITAAILLFTLITFNPDKTYVSDDALPEPWTKQVPLSKRLHPGKVIECLEKAEEKLGLKDGIAFYWSARPARFASDFDFYFAQVSPWNVRGGYDFWGANAMEFIYKDSSRKNYRNYNYILASDSDLSGKFWGSILSKASEKINCGNYHIFYYSDPGVLSRFLFPWGVPLTIDGNGKETLQTKALNPDPGSWVNTLDFPASDLKTTVGRINNGIIYTDNKEGFLVYGPYINLPTGHYELTVNGDLQSSSGSIGVLDAVGDGVNKTILKQSIVPKALASGQSQEKLLRSSSDLISAEGSSELAQFQFTIDKPLRQAEFRIYIHGYVSGNFQGYVLRRRPL